MKPVLSRFVASLFLIVIALPLRAAEEAAHQPYVVVVGIDAAGDIVAYGTNASGQTHEYLLTPAESPIPEPSSLAVMSLAIAAVAIRQIRRSGKS